MRTTLNLSDDAFHVAKHFAQREGLSFGDAVSVLIRAAVASPSALDASSLVSVPLRGRFALLPMRDEVITVEHVRQLLEREVF